MRFVVLLCAAASLAGAQTNSAADAVFARAKQLVVGGNGAAGRVLVDSVLAATTPDTPLYADALYWRAALAASPDDAERDYRRLIVEYPLSPKTGEATYQLAQLESARGDRAAAAGHLQRFVLENPKADERPRAYMQLVRMLFEQNDFPRGCSALHDALSQIPRSDVESRNQLEYYSPRCTANDAGPGGRVPLSPPAAAAPPNDTSKREAAARGAPAKFTLQIAAYASRTEAETLVRRLKARKLDARVVTSGKLYRVRIGRYPSRAAAAAAQKDLKAKKISAFVTDIEPDAK
ncbi:MAG TPA: SPOR domain-containing protein [Gemmatimonadaceae bacterium]|jgi:cell division protein FtsN|nr:SPOR domain-containing protein [Gemmatimonadaceae bacterium]